MLVAISVVAYVFFARSAHEMLEPLLALPEGQAAYAAALRRAVGAIVLFDLPLLAVVGVAAYVLAHLSIRPLLAAREREERFTADAAHELRTPLATVAALAQAARDGDAGAQAGALAKITALALDASALLGDLLALMRDDPDHRLDEPVDVAAMLGGIVREARERSPALDIALTVPPDGAYVVGEERGLRQLAHNLMMNALRHARSRVTTGVRAEPRTIVLWVEDDGEGVAAAVRERIFERFFKAQPSSPGSGLGLAICRHIAVRHGGTIGLEDRSRFVVRFPRASG